MNSLPWVLGESTAFAVYVGTRGVVNWVWDEVSVALTGFEWADATTGIVARQPGRGSRGR